MPLVNLKHAHRSQAHLILSTENQISYECGHVGCAAKVDLVRSDAHHEPTAQ
jgi:hypothetical protein